MLMRILPGVKSILGVRFDVVGEILVISTVDHVRNRVIVNILYSLENDLLLSQIVIDVNVKLIFTKRNGIISLLYLIGTQFVDHHKKGSHLV
jgi:hypothetical protein